MMWLVLVLTAVFVDSINTVLIRRKQKEEDISSSLKIFLGMAVVEFPLLILIYALGLSESGDLPWVIILHKPALLVPILCTFFFYLTMLLSFHYIRVADYSVVDSFSGILIFAGILLVNAFLGKVNGAEALFSPMRLLPLAGMLAGAFLLNRFGGTPEEAGPGSGKNLFVPGLLFAVISTVFDAADTVSTSYLLSAEDADSWDFIVVYAFVFGVGGILCWVYLCAKNSRLYNPFSRPERVCCLVGLLEIITDVADTQATALSAVRVQVVWVAAPAVPILLASVFLKEKITFRQAVCIGLVLVCSGLFTLADLFSV